MNGAKARALACETADADHLKPRRKQLTSSLLSVCRQEELLSGETSNVRGLVGVVLHLTIELALNVNAFLTHCL